MAGVRDEKAVIEAAHERVGRAKHFMLKDAEKLFGQRVLADAVVMPERGKCAPAHMKRGIDMCETPVEDAFELFPIIHFVKIELFHGRAGNDHAVKTFVFDVLEGLIESIEMVARDVPAAVRGGLKQRELYLQRRISKEPRNLRFRCDLVGIKLSARIRSGLMSCVRARPGDMTKMFSSRRRSLAGSPLGRMTGIAEVLRMGNREVSKRRRADRAH